MLISLNTYAVEPKDIFEIWIEKGIVKPTLKNDDRQMYLIVINNDSINIAYKAEIINYIINGEFIFNEDLKD